jgi:hypothetical protein|tara:strand:+ start:522 stop:953 length:432 start_codon:yes stop_codon:yes gene_type:complete
MRRLFISASLWLLISAAIALCFYDKTFISFLKWFIAAAAIQSLLQYFINQILNAKYGMQLTQLETSLAEELNRNIKPIACPCYFKHIQNINIDLNGENKYSCNKCNKDISVVVNLESAVSTKPVDSIKANFDPKIVIPTSGDE